MSCDETPLASAQAYLYDQKCHPGRRAIEWEIGQFMSIKIRAVFCSMRTHRVGERLTKVFENGATYSSQPILGICHKLGHAGVSD